MNRIILAGIAAVAVGSAAHSQGIEGGQIKLGYARNITDKANVTSLAGSAVMGLSGPLGVQGDLARRWDKGPDNTTVTGHLVYQVSPNAAVGGFLSWDHVPGSYLGRGVGVEGKVRLATSAPVTLEGYVMRNSGSGSIGNYTGLGANAAVEITPQSRLKAGLFTASDKVDMQRYSVGLGYQFGSGVALDMDLARLHQPSDTKNIVSLGLSYKFGAGSTFGGRGLMDAIQGN